MAENDSISSGSGSNPNPCPICLQSVNQESYLDKCLHKFCYNCIIRWSNVVSSKESCEPSSLKCPMCKTENFSIIYGYDGSSFQQRYISKSIGDSSEFFSEGHKYRLKCYYTEPGDLAEILHVSRYWKLHKYLKQNNWLQEWLRREIQAVMQDEDVDIIMHHIIGLIDSWRSDILKRPRIQGELVREEFRVLVSGAGRPFLTGRTERFVDELELFLASGLNIDAFDEVCMKHLGWKVVGSSEEEQNEPVGHAPVFPYLNLFDEDLDGNGEFTV